jgi:class 3 adenylate cyclase
MNEMPQYSAGLRVSPLGLAGALLAASVRDWGARLMRREAASAGTQRSLQLYLDVDASRRLPATRPSPPEVHRWDGEIAPVAHARALDAAGEGHLPVIVDDEGPEEVRERIAGSWFLRDDDRVLATVLFTDICRSTERAAAMGDARWRKVLAEHDRLVRLEVERHGGRLVKSTGDGALAIFAAPARAIACAAAIRHAVAGLGLEVRAGVHTGECELLGDDVAGLAVHIGARVAARAGAGEIWVSRTVADLVAGSGLPFQDRGEHELRGVPGSWRLLSVAEPWPGAGPPPPEARSRGGRRAQGVVRAPGEELGEVGQDGEHLGPVRVPRPREAPAPGARGSRGSAGPLRPSRQAARRQHREAIAGRSPL